MYTVSLSVLKSEWKYRIFHSEVKYSAEKILPQRRDEPSLITSSRDLKQLDQVVQLPACMAPCHIVYCFQKRYLAKRLTCLLNFQHVCRLVTSYIAFKHDIWLKKMIYLFAFQYVWRLLTLYIDFKHTIFRKVWNSCSLFYMPTIYILPSSMLYDEKSLTSMSYDEKPLTSMLYDDLSYKHDLLHGTPHQVRICL